MTNKLAFSSRLTFILKNLLISYLLTAGLLLLLSLLLYRFSLSEKIVSLGITAIYAVTTFLAGSLAGKREQTRCFLWGLLMGILYFSLLSVISVIVNHGFTGFGGGFISAFVVCAASGMLGGMLS